MGEFWFVLKSLVVTVLLLFGMQLQVGNQSIESRMIHWTQNSSIAKFLQAVAEGGIRATQDGFSYVSNQLGGKSAAQEASAQFGRLNLNMERSPAVKKVEER
jgi:hypothetical protein